VRVRSCACERLSVLASAQLHTTILQLVLTLARFKPF